MVTINSEDMQAAAAASVEQKVLVRTVNLLRLKQKTCGVRFQMIPSRPAASDKSKTA